MSNPAPGSGDIFDVKRLRRLIELMQEHDLSEIDLRQSDQRICLRKGHDPIVVAGASAAAPPVASGPRPKDAGKDAPPPPDDSRLTVIKSPMVGTFYASPDPNSPPFVKVGDAVNAETTVCIIEAMKVFNPIAAECSGKIAVVLVESGSPVEFGQPLFKVDAGK